MKLGIDIGGTDVKFAVISKNEIIYKSKIPSNRESAEKFIEEISEECNRILAEFPYTGIGIGTAGSVCDGVVYAGNLPFKHYPVAEEISKRVGKKTVIDNDANCAAYGEFLHSKKYKNMVLLTFGTGIGGGIIIDNKLCRGNGCIGEFGHMIVETHDGLPCPCGEKGCWEQYASVSALVRKGKEAATANPDSYLAKLCRENGKLNGKLIFQSLDEKCPVAEKVFKEYVDWIAVGIKSINMIIGPDAVILSGGITREGEKLLVPLRAALKKDINIELSRLREDAGVFGAASLV